MSQRMIDWVLRDVRDVVDPYIDDLIVGTAQVREDEPEEELLERHIADVRRVLKALERHTQNCMASASSSWASRRVIAR